jgi:NADH-quinone oxidoreductase subunit C
MTHYAIDSQHLSDVITEALGSLASSVKMELNEVTVVVEVDQYLAAAKVLKSHTLCQFEQLIDLCGLDYSSYKDGEWQGKRFAAVSHLLSVSLNQRVRLVTFANEDEFPVLPSLTELWASANWYEREAFDLFGIVFEGHADLRRILTDYGFVGHPFRKDFPTHGYVEMKYDETLKRVVYQPVSIELREITPRIHRESGYGGTH